MDCNVVSLRSFSTRFSSSYSRSSSQSGQDFYGVIVSVFGTNGTLAYQSCSEQALAAFGMAQAPATKARTEANLCP